MKLDMEVGLSPWDFVLDRDPAPYRKRGEPPIFGRCLLRPNGCMDQDVTWYGGRSRPRRHCVIWGPSNPSPERGPSPLPNFWPMSIVPKRLDGSRWHLTWRWTLVQAGHIVVDGDPAPLAQKTGERPNLIHAWVSTDSKIRDLQLSDLEGVYYISTAIIRKGGIHRLECSAY